MPLNGLRIAQSYTSSPYVSGDSFAPSPFPDETTQAIIQQAAVDQAAAATSTTVNAAVSQFTLPTATPDDGLGPNSIYLDVTPTLSGLKISWNGLDTIGSAMPADFDRVEVYVSSVGGFIPDATTKIGRLFSGGTLYYFSNGVYQRYYVVGIAYDKAGNPSPSSNQISDQPRQITGSDITANTITGNNILSGSVSADRIATGLLYANVKIVVGSYTNNTARIEIDQQTGINLISRDISGVDTTTASLNTVSGVGTIVGGSITGSSIATAMSPNSRIELKGGGIGVRDTLSFYPGSGITGEQPAVVTTNYASSRQQLTLKSPYDGTATVPCSILFQSSLDGSTTGANAPIMTLSSGTIQVSGDLQINSQSVARGIVAYSYVPGTVSGSAGGAEINTMFFNTLITIELNRLYRLRWTGNMSRSDSQPELITTRFRARSGSAGSTLTGTMLYSVWNNLPFSAVGSQFVNETIFIGGVTTVTSPGTNAHYMIPAGQYDFSMNMAKVSGSANTATIGMTSGMFTLEDVGT